EDRVDLFKAADIVLFPSRLDCFGIVVLEAWISGKPVIGCWSGGMPDMIRDGENGFLVSWGDTAALTNRIEILLTDREAGRIMGGNGRKDVLDRWTWDKVTDRFYRRLSQCCPEVNRQ
ncbi:MAG: glycosyltransferase family 4 protein, partial [Candidatus Fermentibacteria bacterium]